INRLRVTLSLAGLIPWLSPSRSGYPQGLARLDCQAGRGRSPTWELTSSSPSRPSSPDESVSAARASAVLASAAADLSKTRDMAVFGAATQPLGPSRDRAPRPLVATELASGARRPSPAVLIWGILADCGSFSGSNRAGSGPGPSPAGPEVKILAPIIGQTI